MINIWFWIYNIFIIPLMKTGSLVVSLWNNKVYTGLKGRKGLFKQLESELKQFTQNHPRFWIHNSSMGEFEQAKPIIKQLKKEFPDSFIIVTFFSPSGYEHSHNYKEADKLSYIPFDSYFGARKFVKIVKPDLAIMIKYDLWPNHLWYLFKKKIPVLLVNASVRPSVLKGKGLLRKFFISIYNRFDAILTISSDAKDFLSEVLKKTERIIITGDTRYDQVLNIAESAEKVTKNLRKFIEGTKCLVAGSTWPSDEKHLIPALKKVFSDDIDFCVILVPHEPTKEHIAKLQNQLTENNLRYKRISQLDGTSNADFDVLIVDTVGILASLYALADLTYVGGSFYQGIHSVLEPAAFGKPVIFGPKYTNSVEAVELLKNGGGVKVTNSMEIYNTLKSFLTSDNTMEKFGQRAGVFVKENQGATSRIIEIIKKYL